MEKKSCCCKIKVEENENAFNNKTIVKKESLFFWLQKKKNPYIKDIRIFL